MEAGPSEPTYDVDETGMPILPQLEPFYFNGRQFKRRPCKSSWSGAVLAQAQAAWDAVDNTPERREIKRLIGKEKARRREQLRVRKRTADDNDRRVEQRSNSEAQQEHHRGTPHPLSQQSAAQATALARSSTPTRERRERLLHQLFTAPGDP